LPQHPDGQLVGHPASTADPSRKHATPNRPAAPPNCLFALLAHERRRTLIGLGWLARAFRGHSRFAAVLILAVVAAFLFPALAAGQTPAPTDGLLDGLVHDYETYSASWLERIAPLAQRTFAILAALEFAVSGIWWALGRDSLDEIGASLLKKFILLSFLFSLIYLFPLWVPFVTRGFQTAGQTAAGVNTLNPSQLLDIGLTIASNMLLSFGSLGFLANPTGNIVASITGFFVVLAYTVIAARICLTLIESYIVLTGGLLFLGFAGFRLTATFAENYILYAFYVGTKIYLLYLLIGVGTAMSQRWASLPFTSSTLVFPPSLTPHFHVMAGAVIFALLAWKLPSSVAARLTQGASFRLQDALR
jgi:type IV secretion system protein TrbL